MKVIVSEKEKIEKIKGSEQARKIANELMKIGYSFDEATEIAYNDVFAKKD